MPLALDRRALVCAGLFNIEVECDTVADPAEEAELPISVVVADDCLGVSCDSFGGTDAAETFWFVSTTLSWSDGTLEFAAVSACVGTFVGVCRFEELACDGKFTGTLARSERTG